MKILILSIPFLFLCSLSFAQDDSVTTLQIIFPKNFTYDTLLVKDGNKAIAAPYSSSEEGNKIVSRYVIKSDKEGAHDYSIYFGGSRNAVNDTLFFLSADKNMKVELEDSFALRNDIYMDLSGTYNFEKLYQEYNEYCQTGLVHYDSLMKEGHSVNMNRYQYFHHLGLAFVKEHRRNPYAIELFSVFVINNPFYRMSYQQAETFYRANLAPLIKDSTAGNYVEVRLNALKKIPVEGDEFPAFSVTTLDGKKLNNSSVKGKNVLWVLWATWCGPCMAEIPSLKKVRSEFSESDLKIIGVSLDVNRDKLMAVVKKDQLKWPQVYNNQAFVSELGVTVIPALVLLNSDGEVIYHSYYHVVTPEKNLSEVVSLLKKELQKGKQK